MERNQVIRRKGRVWSTEYITVPYRTLKFQQKIVITTTTFLGHTVVTMWSTLTNDDPLRTL